MGPGPRRRVPAEADHHAAGRAPGEGARGPFPATVRREHILHVDDEETLVVLTARILQRIGYRVTSFTDSQEALEAFAKAPGDFDAVVTDIDMPGLNGFQLVQALRRERVGRADRGDVGRLPRRGRADGGVARPSCPSS